MTPRTLPGGGVAVLLLLAAITALPRPAQAQTPVATPQWGTYLGGTGVDRISGVAQTLERDIIVAGSTTSQTVTPTPGPGTRPSHDVLVSLFDLDGLLLAGPRIFGGSGDDEATAVAYATGNSFYVVGTTRSPASSLTNAGTIYLDYMGQTDAFLARVSLTGTVEWFMYLGGSGNDVATGVAVSSEAVYITGSTDSAFFSGGQGAIHGGVDGFVVKVDVASVNPRVLWRSVIGGAGTDAFSGIALSATSALVVGTTSSSVLSPGNLVLNTYRGGTSDALAVKLDTASAQIAWAAYVGGAGVDEGRVVVAGLDGELVVAGTRTGGAGQPAGKNAFAVWLTPQGAERQSRTWGGSAADEVLGAAVDPYGTVYVGGRTGSADFPVDKAFDQTIEAGTALREGFVAALPHHGGPGWVSFFGGNDVDDVRALSFRQTQLILAGSTASSSGLFSSATYDASLSTPPDGYLATVQVRDITPPTAGTVRDRLQLDDVPEDVDEQTSSTSLSANWTQFFDSAGITRYEWAIGTEAQPESILPFSPVGLQTKATVAGLSLKPGTTYVVSVRAINSSGLSVVARSDGVLVWDPSADGGTDTPDGGTGTPDGGADAGSDGGTSGNDAGPGEPLPDEEEERPLLGWGCTASDASLSMLLALLALSLLARRGGTSTRR